MDVPLNTVIVQPSDWLELERQQALDASKYGRYFEDGDFSIHSAKVLLLDQFERLTSNKNTIVVKAYDESALKGIAILRKSPWDTDHFGFGVAILEHVIPFSESSEERFHITRNLLGRVNLWLHESGIDFISARIPSLDLSVIQAAEQEGFRFIESWVYSKFNLKAFVKPPNIPSLRYATVADKALMLEYSKGAFVTQRFHADPRFSTQKADELYEKWVTSAFDDPTQKIAVLEVDAKPSAFMIYYHQTTAGAEAAKYAMWKFTVIDPAMRGKGVGKVFFDALKAHHQTEGAEFIESGVTLRNLPSMNLHNSLNFKIISSLTTLHKWQY
jgi:GNAT superfamily N-acetyltransferase